MKATEITKKLKEQGYTYYGETPKAWEANSFGRIYFGRDYVTVDADGTIHGNKKGKARANTIGHTAVEAVREAAK